MLTCFLPLFYLHNKLLKILPTGILKQKTPQLLGQGGSTSYITADHGFTQYKTEFSEAFVASAWLWAPEEQGWIGMILGPISVTGFLSSADKQPHLFPAFPRNKWRLLLRTDILDDLGFFYICTGWFQDPQFWLLEHHSQGGRAKTLDPKFKWQWSHFKVPCVTESSLSYLHTQSQTGVLDITHSLLVHRPLFSNH